MNEISKLIELLNQFYGMPVIAVVFFSAIVFGYLWKCVAWLPNRLIPAAVVLGSGICLVLLSTRTSGESFRIWLVKNFLLGIIVGLLAWLVHNKALKRLEERFGLFEDNEKKPQEEKETVIKSP